MKKKVVYLLLAVIIIGVMALAGCSGNPKVDQQTADQVVAWLNAHPDALNGVNPGILPKGDRGDTGPAGPAGKDGTNGTNGTNGKDGAAGPAGPKGDTGARGATGATGAIGPAGPQGAPGNTGSVGPAGFSGPQGPAGVFPAFAVSFNVNHSGQANVVYDSTTGTTAVSLVTTGTVGNGDSGTIVLTPNQSLTLGQLSSISWQEWLNAGYPPHVDVTVMQNDGTIDTLVFEYGYNTPTHYAEGQITGPTAYGALTGAWYATFSDDAGGPAAVTGTSFAWLNSGAAGPYPAGVPPFVGAFTGGTLAQWQAGAVTGTINGTCVVTKIEIEVDNWFIQTSAFVHGIMVNGVSVLP